MIGDKLGRSRTSEPKEITIAATSSGILKENEEKEKINFLDFKSFLVSVRDREREGGITLIETLCAWILRASYLPLVPVLWVSGKDAVVSYCYFHT